MGVEVAISSAAAISKVAISNGHSTMMAFHTSIKFTTGD